MEHKLRKQAVPLATRIAKRWRHFIAVSQLYGFAATVLRKLTTVIQWSCVAGPLVHPIAQMMRPSLREAK